MPTRFSEPVGTMMARVCDVVSALAHTGSDAAGPLSTGALLSQQLFGLPRVGGEAHEGGSIA